MLKFIKTISDKHKAKVEYWTKLKEFLADEKLDESEQKKLGELAKELELSENELKEIHKRAASLEWEMIIKDGVITEEEKIALQELVKHFGLNQADFSYDQKTFNKMYSLGLIQKGILPTLKQHDLKTIFKSDEIVHWACPATLKKHKRVTKKISYAGPRASIRIAKGVSYRVGSYKFATQSQDYVVTEDIGAFWLTNKRVGFEGQKKNFSFPYGKILNFELSPEGLVIAKDGRENPYILVLDDFEVPAAILSHILNS